MKTLKVANVLRITVMLVLVLGVIPMLPLIVSGRWDWWQAWVMAVIFSLGFLVSRGMAIHKTPDLLAERANYNQHANTQPWDKWLSPVVAFGSALILLFAGLDARFQWSAGFPLSVELLGLLMVLVGYVIGTLAMISNAFFSGTVRIQSDRGHAVVSSGPYAFVRHPGYLGVLITYLGIPFLLDSAVAFIPALIIVALLVLRTRLEDRFLQDNLSGYREYAEKVRYRLLPGIW